MIGDLWFRSREKKLAKPCARALYQTHERCKPYREGDSPHKWAHFTERSCCQAQGTPFVIYIMPWVSAVAQSNLLPKFQRVAEKTYF